MKPHSIPVIFLLLALWLSACAPLASSSAASETPVLVAESPSEEVTTPEPTPELLATPIPSPTVAITLPPTAVGLRECVETANVPPLLEGDFADYPEKIKVFLNLGGSAERLARSLYDLELAFASDEHVPVQLADLTGDDLIDVVVSVHDPSQAGNPPQGALYIFTCWEGQFVFTHFEPSPPGLGTPGIIHIQDINVDGLEELIISSLQIGVHSTFEFMQILSWDGSRFVNQLNDITGDLPFPQIQITDFDGDGIYDLEITSTGYGSVGAGPQRQVIRSWVYEPNSGTWERFRDEFGFSPYRIHTLHDADDAMGRGEYEIALLLYGLVVSDTGLLDWIDPETEQQNLAAYARYKMVVANMLRDDPAAAAQILGVMQGQYPDFLDQYPYYEMAEIFYNAQPLVGTDAACAAMHTYAEQHAASVLYPLGVDSEVFPEGGAPFGYANARYTPARICP